MPGLGLRKALRNGPTPKQYTRAAAPDICPGVYQVTCPRHTRDSACPNLSNSFELTVWEISSGEKIEPIQGLQAHVETHEVVCSRTRAGVVVHPRFFLTRCFFPWSGMPAKDTLSRVYKFHPALSAIEKMV